MVDLLLSKFYLDPTLVVGYSRLKISNILVCLYVHDIGLLNNESLSLHQHFVVCFIVQSV